MLAFHFGVMGSGKSAFALMTAHEKNRPDAASHPNRAVLATTMDRSTETVTSRTGMTAQAIQLQPGTIRPELFNGANTVVIDEAQFLTAGDVDVLAAMSAAGTEVICFGLRTDFSSALFEGARRLLELADKVAPMAIEPRCAACERPAVINARFVDGRLTATGRHRRHRRRRPRRGQPEGHLRPHVLPLLAGPARGRRRQQRGRCRLRAGHRQRCAPLTAPLQEDSTWPG